MNLSSYSNYFHIKNLFSNLFIQFQAALDWASMTEDSRGLGVKCLRHREQLNRTAGSFSNTIRVLLQIAQPKGYRQLLAARSDLKGAN
jgi:hypothetical protein